jgi:hypothetical protein
VIDNIFLRSFGPIQQTAPRFCFNLIRELYNEAAEEWDNILAKYDGNAEGLDILPNPSAVDGHSDTKITQYIDKVIEGGGRLHTQEHLQRNESIPGGLRMSRCAWCSSVSLSLRRCGGCNLARRAYFYSIPKAILTRFKGIAM